MERWDDVRFFLAIARESSLSGAARALRVDQDTVVGIDDRWRLQRKAQPKAPVDAVEQPGLRRTRSVAALTSFLWGTQQAGKRDKCLPGHASEQCRETRTVCRVIHANRRH